MRAGLEPEQREFVSLNGVCTQEEIDRLLAESLFLVQPSLEEGFGLPPHEALSVGLPVCCSKAGGLPEATYGMARLFFPTSTQDMQAAIDDCATQAQSWTQADREALSKKVREAAPTLTDFTDTFLRAIAKYSA